MDHWLLRCRNLLMFFTACENHGDHSENPGDASKHLPSFSDTVLIPQPGTSGHRDGPGFPLSAFRNPLFSVGFPLSAFILMAMNNNSTAAPLVRWDGLHLVFDLEGLKRVIIRSLKGVDNVCDLSLTGEGDTVRIGATVIWNGLRSRVAVELSEIRLKDRFLGLRMRRARVLGGVPVPRAALEMILRRLSLDGVTVFRGQSIVVMDLRRWLAPELDLNVLTVQTTRTALHVWLGPGELQDLPAPQPPALPEGSADPENDEIPVES